MEQCRIDVLIPCRGAINYPHVQQIAWTTRYREPIKDGKPSTEVVYVMTSVRPEQASPEKLLQLNRGHWCVENLNRRHRDCWFGEDDCPIHQGHGPLNRALGNILVLAVLFSTRPSQSTSLLLPHYQLNRSEVLDVVLKLVNHRGLSLAFFTSILRNEALYD